MFVSSLPSFSIMIIFFFFVWMSFVRFKHAIICSHFIIVAHVFTACVIFTLVYRSPCYDGGILMILWVWMLVDVVSCSTYYFILSALFSLPFLPLISFHSILSIISFPPILTSIFLFSYHVYSSISSCCDIITVSDRNCCYD